MVQTIFFLIYLFYYFIYLLFLAALGLRRCGQALLRLRRAEATPRCGARASRRGGLPRCGARAPGARAPAVVALGLQSAGSAVMAHGLSCSTACGIPPDQGSNPCPLHWQADSQPLRHQGSPRQVLKDFIGKRCIFDLENQGKPNGKISICSGSLRMIYYTVYVGLMHSSLKKL